MEDNKKTVKLVTFTNPAEAHILVGALDEEGIPAILHNENMSSILFGLSMMGVDVFVYEDDLEVANRVLQRIEDQKED